MASVLVTLTPETENRLREKAQKMSLTLEEYLRHLAEGDAANGETSRADCLDKILTPIREGFARSGLSEEELTSLFEEAREEVWHDRKPGS